MEKLILLMGFVILLTGCFSNPIKVKTEVQETLVPMLYSPAPPVIDRPELLIHKMTDEELKQAGMVAKYYKATIKTLIGYAQELEAALAEYDKINKSYEEERKKLEAKQAEKKTTASKSTE